jgi:polar amino acid transport system substrate-binding protein
MKSFLFLAFFLSSSIPLEASQVQAPATKTFTIGIESIDYYPHQITNEKGEISGFTRELLDTFAKNKGIKFVYTPLPVKRLFISFLANQVDFKYPDNAYWQSELKQGKEVVYSNSVVDYIDGVMVKKENSDLRKLKTLAIMRGFTPLQYLVQIKKKELSFIESDEHKSLFLLVTSGRAEGCYFDIVVAQYQLKKMGMSGQLVFNSNLPYTKSSYSLSTINHPEIINDLNQFLVEQKKLVDELKKKYGVVLPANL